MTNRPRLSGPARSTAAMPERRVHPAALRVRGRIAGALLALHAISPEDAVDIPFEPRDAAAFAKLRAAGIVREVPGGRVWFDLVAYHLRDRARSRVATITAFIVAMAIAAGALLFYRV